MKCSVFIATSVDGYIASKNGAVDWLYSCGDQTADMANQQDMGFNQFIASVDCMIMGRKCMEVIASMNLSEADWPYGNMPIYVLSNTLTVLPKHLPPQVTLYSGDIKSLTHQLSQQGFSHCYVDGGSTITQFLNLGLINQMTITQAPLLLGEGIHLFGSLLSPISLTALGAIHYPNGFIQLQYQVTE